MSIKLRQQFRSQNLKQSIKNTTAKYKKFDIERIHIV